MKYCHDMLCVTFGIDPAEITYVENPGLVEEMQDLLLK